MNEYVKRNQLWLYPLLAGLVLSATPVLVKVIDPSIKLPDWIGMLGLIVAGLCTGIGAAITETRTAKIVKFLGFAFAISVILFAIFPIVQR